MLIQHALQNTDEQVLNFVERLPLRLVHTEYHLNVSSVHCALNKLFHQLSGTLNQPEP